MSLICAWSEGETYLKITTHDDCINGIPATLIAHATNVIVYLVERTVDLIIQVSTQADEENLEMS